MQDAVNTLMLICASIAALAFGLLAAYGTCRVAFFFLQIHARSVAPQAVLASKLAPKAQIQSAS